MCDFSELIELFYVVMVLTIVILYSAIPFPRGGGGLEADVLVWSNSVVLVQILYWC